MKRLHICIIDLIYNAPTNALYYRLMFGNHMSIMPQVIGVWCRQQGHEVTYIMYGGSGNLMKEIPEGIDVAFISSFTFTAQLAYAISNYLRTRGVVTVLGGSHARCYPEDSCKYFDYVLGMTDRKLIHEILQGFSQQRPSGIHLSNNNQPLTLPGVEERWDFIEKAFSNGSLIKIVPEIGSFGCPYQCNFCVDANIPYQMLDWDYIKEDLRFLIRKMKRPRVGWYDPNFGLRFDEMMSAIEEVVPMKSMDFIAECSLSCLSEANTARLKRNGFIFIMTGIESWFGYNNKTGSGGIKGIEKVKQVADQLNMIQRYIPYVHANFILGSDVDRDSAPFELTKMFIERAPGVHPVFLLLNAYGRGAPVNLEYQRANRVLPFPFHFLQSVYTLNVRPAHYTWTEFYDYLIDLLQYSVSGKVIYNRFKAINKLLPRWLGLLWTLTIGGAQKIEYHLEIRRQLLADQQFRRFFEQETIEIPDFFIEKIRKDLGPFWPWLPEGAICHNPNAHLESITENGKKIPVIF